MTTRRIYYACRHVTTSGGSNAGDNAPPRTTYMRGSVAGGRVHPLVRPPSDSSFQHYAYFPETHRSSLNSSVSRSVSNARINAPPYTTNMREPLKGGRVE